MQEKQQHQHKKNKANKHHIKNLQKKTKQHICNKKTLGFFYNWSFNPNPKQCLCFPNW
jgi:hypothetical protein